MGGLERTDLHAGKRLATVFCQGLRLPRWTPTPPSIRPKAVSISFWAILRICFFCCSVSAGGRPPRPRLRFGLFGDMIGSLRKTNQINHIPRNKRFSTGEPEKKKGGRKGAALGKIKVLGVAD